MNQSAIDTKRIYERYHGSATNRGALLNYQHFSAVRVELISQAQLFTDYLREMIDGVVRELETGYTCWLLRAVTQGALQAVHVLDYSAIMYVYNTVVRPGREPRLDTRWIPYTSRFSDSVAGLMYNDSRIARFTVDLRTDAAFVKACAALLDYAAQHGTPASSADDADALRAQLAALTAENAALRQALKERDNLIAQLRGQP